MPLHWFESGEVVKSVPHQRENQPVIDRIPLHNLTAIRAEINRLIDAVCITGENIITAGWMPGNDWTGTVWDSIYIAANKSFPLSGMIFGALVFEEVMNRQEDWYCGKFEKDGIPIGSMTYFQRK